MGELVTGLPAQILELEQPIDQSSCKLREDIAAPQEESQFLHFWEPSLMEYCIHNAMENGIVIESSTKKPFVSSSMSTDYSDSMRQTIKKDIWYIHISCEEHLTLPSVQMDRSL